MTVRIDKCIGRYDFCHPNEKQWSVTLHLPENAPARHISETWPEDDEPDIYNDTPPSEVAEIIGVRIEDYLFQSDRDKKRKIIEWCEENAEELDREWAKAKIKNLGDTIKKYRRYL